MNIAIAYAAITWTFLIYSCGKRHKLNLDFTLIKITTIPFNFTNIAWSFLKELFMKTAVNKSSSTSIRVFASLYLVSRLKPPISLNLCFYFVYSFKKKFKLRPFAILKETRLGFSKTLTWVGVLGYFAWKLKLLTVSDQNWKLYLTSKQQKSYKNATFSAAWCYVQQL